jgi:hypothetical protein
MSTNSQKVTNGGAVSNEYRPPDDAYDIDSLYLDNGVGDPLTAESRHTVPLGKPRDFFRTHPDLAYRRRVEIYAHKSENVISEQHYVLGPAMQGRIQEARPCALICVVDRLGQPRLWPIMEPRDGEKDNDAWISARAAAREWLTGWVRLVWQGRGYLTRKADLGYAPEPDFNRLPSFDDLLRIALGDHGTIRNEEHPIYRDLFGKAPAPDDGDPLA